MHTPAPTTTPDSTTRRRTATEAATRRVADYYSTRYGSEFSALIRLPHDDFNL